MWNKCLAALFVISLLFIGVVAGSVLSYFRLPPSQLVSEALQWAQAWSDIHKAERKSKHFEESKKAPSPPTVYWNKSKSLNGFTLLSKMYSPNVQLIDMQGKVVHSWNVPFRSIWPKPEHLLNSRNVRYYMQKAHVFPNGDLLVQYTASFNTPYGAGLAKFDKDANLIWKYSENEHHDFYIDQSNGDIYGLTQKMLLESPEGFEKLKFPMLVDYIVRLDSAGKELQRVSLLEAFKNSPYYSMLLYERRRQGWDRLHTNSVMKLEPQIADKFPMFKAGQVLVSIRNPSIIAVVDMEETSVVWAAQGAWKMQHDAKFLPDGTISMFDNLGAGKYSRVLMIKPDSNEIVRELSKKDVSNFFSPFMSKTQLLSNQNVLITSSLQRNAFEITPDGKMVWDYKYRQNAGGILLEAHRYTSKEVPFLFEQKHAL